ncbi:DUF3073 domain-containing protein [Nesterenkonia aerolata]|uniref:DUF3073 domain-containing protein n=1 Tax=Nesterenkonia aerolata TaxID=3074079 RepID=A0ABU2DSC4_9MICC|nr:DUF3073 domain-containing protein [Nesterenkonia sp. LY-0111]MDR8019275.1 DUF3073 domain-containing protein [Nesterenkonia sp. LY-0111]
MGRGRQKAKATKQAREIKYFTPDTDLSALERELAQKRGDSFGESPSSEDEYGDYDDVADRYGR